jgi:16S rRNA (guanine527-N7)-methyltransferase
VPPRDLRTRLARRSLKAGFCLSDDLTAGLTSYYELLSRWNSKINLTALDNPDEAIDRLLLEPVVAARQIPPGPVCLMDVGSGGGSPAIPMALTHGPQTELTMVEVKARKSAFLREAVRTLNLGSANVETTRYEELLARPELHEHFDVLSLRAVKVDPKVLMTLQAFLRPGGVMLLFRGPAGGDAPEGIIPPLEWRATVPLVDSLRSRLTVLAKKSAGGVPRGTVVPMASPSAPLAVQSSPPVGYNRSTRRRNQPAK